MKAIIQDSRTDRSQQWHPRTSAHGVCMPLCSDASQAGERSSGQLFVISTPCQVCDTEVRIYTKYFVEVANR